MFICIKKVPYIAVFVSAVVVIISCAGGAVTSSESGRPPSQRQMKAQAKAEADADRERESAAKEIQKLQDARVNLMGLNIPCGIGTGEASSEAEASRAATEAAREAALASTDFQVQGLAATYAHNVAAATRKTWGDRVMQQASQAVAQAPVYKKVISRNRAEGTYTVTALVILAPEIFKKALADAAFVNSEFQRQAQHDRMMSKMDAVIKDFNSKYRKEI